MTTKTTYEKEAEKLTVSVLRVLGGNFDKALFDKSDALAMISFKPVADVLKNKRTEINGDFKAFCKSKGFQQYKIKYIEEGSLKNIDLNLLMKYIRSLNAEKEIRDWISKYPHVAKKYKIDTIVQPNAPWDRPDVHASQ